MDTLLNEFKTQFLRSYFYMFLLFIKLCFIIVKFATQTKITKKLMLCRFCTS